MLVEGDANLEAEEEETYEVAGEDDGELVDDHEQEEVAPVIGEGASGDVAKDTSPVKRSRSTEGDVEDEEVVQGKRAKMDGESLDSLDPRLWVDTDVTGDE